MDHICYLAYKKTISWEGADGGQTGREAQQGTADATHSMEVLDKNEYILYFYLKELDLLFDILGGSSLPE